MPPLRTPVGNEVIYYKVTDAGWQEVTQDIHALLDADTQRISALENELYPLRPLGAAVATIDAYMEGNGSEMGIRHYKNEFTARIGDSHSNPFLHADKRDTLYATLLDVAHQIELQQRHEYLLKSGSV